ncbi:hypothetical protein POM88_048926 [Heracleum sosnowskyi]|uniref:DUF4371 domain-containing protein n=1 Tax=Heracleum sosnowskyi TaxID=360622 RepID=A0AAD8GUP0_9APIA|nr:hypothetical protein POM88_048926 [Heracleum sosnowskyi]
MDKFLIKLGPASAREPTIDQTKGGNQDNNVESSSNYEYVVPDFANLPADPGLRLKITKYHLNDRDKVRRAYLQKGPCQPREHNFKKQKIGNLLRRFNPAWGDNFVTEGFDSWNKKDRLDDHVRGPNSAHKQAWRTCQDLMKQDQHIDVVINRHSELMKRDYRTRLTASVVCLRVLLRQGLAFRGHDELNDSKNQGNFLELLKFLAMHNEEINVAVGHNAPGNLKVTSPDVQHDIINAFATETINGIIRELGNNDFTILVDESRDISIKEQMIVVLRFVNKNGCVVERFMGIVHVQDTSASSLKLAIDSLFAKHELMTLSKQRLQILRDDGWDDLLGELCSFCEKHSILVLSMDEGFQMKGRSRRKTHQVIHSTPILHQGTHFDFGSGHDTVGDFSTNSSNEVKDAILISTQFRESVNTSGFSNFSRKDQETHFDSGSGHDPVGDFSTNSTNAVKDAILIDTQLKESVNTSGFSNFSRKDCDLNDTQDYLSHLIGSVDSVGELISSVLIAPKQKGNKSLDFDGGGYKWKCIN